jgi:hypothetical protein
MTSAARKLAVAAYKEQPTIAGVFAVICTATGQVWVGRTAHIDTRQNGLWSALKFGGCPFRSLQEAWSAHAPEDFRFEQLDRLPADVSDLRRDDELKKRAQLWTARLDAVLLDGR